MLKAGNNGSYHLVVVLGKVFRIGKQSISVNAQTYYNTVRPDGWGDLQFRLQVQLLFTKKTK